MTSTTKRRFARVDHLPSAHVHHRLLRHELQLDDPDHWQRERLRAARRDLAYSVCQPDGGVVGVVAAAQTVICWFFPPRFI